MPCQLKSHSGMEINGMVSCPLALRANTSHDLPSKWQWGVMDTKLMSLLTGTEEWNVVISLGGMTKGSPSVSGPAITVTISR